MRPDGSDQAKDVLALKEHLKVENLNIHVVSISDFNKRIQEKLGLKSTITMEWYYKLCDFKPVLAYLYPEFASEDKYKYWGYGDMDVIWGNFSRFAHWFQGSPQQPFVITGWFGTTGAGAWYLNTQKVIVAEDAVCIVFIRSHRPESSEELTKYS